MSLTPEADYFKRTGRVSLLYPIAIGRAKRMPSPRVDDCGPSLYGSATTSAKRASILGRPSRSKEEDYRNEEITRDNSHDFGAKDVEWLIDGEKYKGSDGERERNYPSADEALERWKAGMMVGEIPGTIVRLAP